MLIQRHDKGENVEIVQQALQAAGINIAVDGDFGGDTYDAVLTFQKQRGLHVDGRVGRDTLIALGLDPDTLEPTVGTSSSDTAVTAEGGGVTTITFTERDTDVPGQVEKWIDGYVAAVAKSRADTLHNLDGALEQFETTMQFASSSEAVPDAAGVIVSQLFDTAVDALSEEVPGLDAVKSFYDKASEEIERAAKAAASFSLGQWIKDQRSVILEMDSAFDQPDPSDPTHGTPRQTLVLDIEGTWLDLDDDGRTTFSKQLVDTTESLGETPAPAVDRFERQLYEEWINANFVSISDDAEGCIEGRLEYDGGQFTFESCTVAAPFGDHVADGVTRLIARNQSGLTTPLDLAVRKRICLYVENFMPGGHSWSCGWFDANDDQIHEPVHPPAKEGLADLTWRSLITEFKRD